MKFTLYFQHIRTRPDRAAISDDMIRYVMENPVHEDVQQDGRIRRWAAIEEMDGRYLRIIVLPDGETVHNAFLDRRFKESHES